MRVAIIEDAATMFSLWYRHLEKTSYRADFFTSKPHEIDELCSFSPHLIVISNLPRWQSASTLIQSFNECDPLKNAAKVVAATQDIESAKNEWNSEEIEVLAVEPFNRENVLKLIDGFNPEKRQQENERPLAVVVDDSPTARSILRKEMESLGFNVKTANDGFDGLDLIKATQPDIVLVDVHMPRKSGLELCADLSSDPKTWRLPTLVISATINDNEVRRGFDSGAIDFLPKPVESSELAKAVSEVMGRGQKPAKWRALVIEDEGFAASIIIKRFDELGIDSVICSDIAQFRSHVSIAIPHIISIDLTLPDGSGLELCKELRENTKMDSVPLVVISSSGERDVMLECLRVGANDFLEKPFTKEEFHVRINNLLRIIRLQDELVRKNRALERLAYHDSLTGLLNRRYFEESLQTEFVRAQREDKPLGLVMVDLDHFKNINDEYGHATGDEILSEICAIIKQNIRSLDIPCRYGGEEICVLLPGCDLVESTKLAERLRSACEISLFTGERITQTVSAGVSAYPVPSTESDLVSDADEALYKAKSAGRNQVVPCTKS